MAINNQPTIKPQTVTGIFTRYIAKTLPLAFDESMSYYECLCALLEYLNKTIVPDINNVNDGLSELQEFYLQLQDYVNNYFENLDVQDEINNKLDEMVEDGVLEQIIEQYINSTALWCYDTVNDLKNSTNLIDGSYARTLGFYSVNDGGNGVYKVRTKLENETTNEMDSIAIGSLLVADLNVGSSVNLLQLGAKGNDTDDDRNVLHYALSNFKKVIVPNGTYKIASNVIVSNNTVLQGYDNSVLHFTAGSENIGPETNYKLNMYNIKIVSDNGIAYHINREGIVDTRIENNIINSNGYGILVNTNTDDGKNIYIANNTISTPSDAIEINTTHNTENKFQNVIIADNILKTYGSSTASTSGFPIGIANGKNVTITGNVIEEARREAIHIEDYSEEVNVIGNVINNCNYHGMRINTISDSYKRQTIANNIINGKKNTGTIGIQLTTAPSGTTNNMCLSGNYISNFDIGIESHSALILDNTSIVNCNKAFKNDITSFRGKVLLTNTPKIVDFSSNNALVNFDDIQMIFTDGTSMPNIDEFITNSATDTIIQINKLRYTLYKPITTEDTTKKIKLLKCPNNVSFEGTITCNIQTGGANRGKSISKVSIKNGVITKELIVQKNSGVFSNSGEFAIENGYLIVSPYNPNQTSGKETCFVSFDGKLIISGAYNIE